MSNRSESRRLARIAKAEWIAKIEARTAAGRPPRQSGQEQVSQHDVPRAVVVREETPEETRPPAAAEKARREAVAARKAAGVPPYARAPKPRKHVRKKAEAERKRLQRERRKITDLRKWAPPEPEKEKMPRDEVIPPLARSGDGHRKRTGKGNIGAPQGDAIHVVSGGLPGSKR